MEPRSADNPASAERCRIAVLGGGMTGMIAARYLADCPSFSVALHERSERLGGLHNSRTIEGRIYDIGAFAFTGDDPIFEAFPGLLDQYHPFRQVFRTVLDGGEVDGYPRTIRGYARRHGLHMTGAAIGLLAAKLRHRRRDSLPAYCRYYLGGAYYRNSGLKHYIERLYGTADEAIDVQFAVQRLELIAKSASLRSIAAKLVTRPFRRPETVQMYARPRAGFDHGYGIVERELRQRGVTVRKSCTIQSIARQGGGFEIVTDAGSESYDEVVSTIPVPLLARLLGIPVEARFTTMQLVTLFYRFEGEPGFDATYLYNFSHDGRWKRIIDFSRVYGGDGRWLSVEITRPGGEAVDAELERKDFERTARALGLFRGDLSFQGHQVTPNAYPLFDREAQAALERDRARLEATGIHIVGRQGRFEYSSSAEGAVAAKELALRLCDSYRAVA